MNEVDSMRMSLAKLKVSPSVKAILRSAGFRTVHDFQKVPVVQLARQLGMDAQKVAGMLAEVRDAAQLEEKRGGQASSLGVTALALITEKELGPPQAIITYCYQLDKLLGGGGVSIGQMTEFCSVPGCGKTQLCMQLAVDVTIPNSFGGLEGECLYIDSEGSFSADRTRDMAEGTLRHLSRQAQSKGDETLRESQKRALEKIGGFMGILSKIRCCRVHNYGEQIAAILNLEKVLQSNPKVKLVIVDSMASHFRQEFVDMAQRNRLLQNVAKTLNGIAQKHKVAVVVTNQMTTKLNNNNTASSTSEGNSAYFAPALGESWAHTVTNRLIIQRTEDQFQETLKRPRFVKAMGEGESHANKAARLEGGSAEISNRQNDLGPAVPTPDFTVINTVRKVSLVKSPSLKQGSATFVIKTEGIRDVARR